MTMVLLILAAIILPVTLLVLTLAVNEFEKHTRELGELLTTRYAYEPENKSDKASEAAKLLAKLGKSKT